MNFCRRRIHDGAKRKLSFVHGKFYFLNSLDSHISPITVGLAFGAAKEAAGTQRWNETEREEDDRNKLSMPLKEIKIHSFLVKNIKFSHFISLPCLVIINVQ